MADEIGNIDTDHFLIPALEAAVFPLDSAATRSRFWSFVFHLCLAKNMLNFSENSLALGYLDVFCLRVCRIPVSPALQISSSALWRVELAWGRVCMLLQE